MNVDPEAAPPAPESLRRVRPAASVFILAILAAIAVAVAVALPPGPLSAPHARRLGPNIPVNPDASDRLAAGVRNSPVLAASPRDPALLAVANRVDSPGFSCRFQVSSDGGASWTQADVPLPPDKVVPCFSPDLAFSPDGRLHVSFTSFATLPPPVGVAPDAVWVTSSPNGGKSFSPLVQVAGTLAFQARLATDPTDARRLLVTWLQAVDAGSFGLINADNPIMASISHDGGLAWSPPARVSPPERLRAVAPVPFFGPGGEVHVVFLDVGADVFDYVGEHQGKAGPPFDGTWSIVDSRSGDGSTWTETVIDGDVVPVARFSQLFPPAPSVAVDRAHGRVYLGFHDGREGSADIRVWTSSDSGRNWSSGRRVNDTPAGDVTTQELAALAVAPNGRLDVAYYDRRGDTADVMTELSLQSSVDGGGSFTRSNRLTDRPFDSRIGVGGDRPLMGLGSRIGLVSTDSAALATWADTRAGTELVGRQDLASAVVGISRERSGAAPRRVVAGLAAAALSVALVLVFRRELYASRIYKTGH